MDDLLNWHEAARPRLPWRASGGWSHALRRRHLLGRCEQLRQAHSLMQRCRQRVQDEALQHELDVEILTKWIQLKRMQRELLALKRGE